MNRASGLTIVETLVAMVILAVIGVALVALMPLIGRTTVAADLDGRQSQRAIAVFERIGNDWSNEIPWQQAIVYVDGNEVAIESYVAAEMSAAGLSCTVAVTSPTLVTKRVTITCDGEGSLPDRQLSAEYGMPSA